MEITIALAVAGFCLLAVVGLLQTGVTSERDTVNRTVATDIVSRIFQDLAGTPRTNTVSPEFGLGADASGLQTIWFSDPSTTNASAAGARYRASITMAPPTGSNRTATAVRLLITWPAAADPDPNSLPSKYTGAVEVATSLDRR